MSKAGDIHNEIAHEWSRLQDSWQDSQATWKDAVAAQFAKRFMEPWEAEMPLFLLKMDALEREIREAQRDLR